MGLTIPLHDLGFFQTEEGYDAPFSLWFRYPAKAQVDLNSGRNAVQENTLEDKALLYPSRLVKFVNYLASAVRVCGFLFIKTRGMVSPIGLML